MSSRTQRPSDRGSDAAGSGHVRGRRRRNEHLQFFTIAEVAQDLNVSERTVRRWIEDGKLVAHRIGGVVRIAETDLRAFLALHRQG
jgi:excisionase family DNA binding protein